MSGFVRRRLSDERGVVGGFEALPFGILVFVVGLLLLVDGWAVVDAKLAVSAAAREATRTFVESGSGSTQAAAAAGEAAALDAVLAQQAHPGAIEVRWEEPVRLERCAPVTAVVRQRVALVNLPWIGGIGPGAITVEGRHREVVDPYRDGVPGTEDGLVESGPCG